MISKLSTALTVLLSLTTTLVSVSASPCVVFDADFNLYVLGYGGKDFNLGTQDSFKSASANDITSSGRPPFDGTNTTCYLSQFVNAIYVMNGDKANPSNVGIYDPKAKSWSTQSVTTTGSNGQSFNPADFAAVLDHDTNVFYALSGGTLFFLDFQQMKSANSSALPWTAVGNPSFTTTGYSPVMALAQNHIHFLNVPGAQPGTAQIFVIHFSFFQPDAQKYPINGSSNNFPVTHGQATSFFLPPPAVQEEFAFIPDDGSQTYVINVQSNTTASLAGPSDKSPSTFTSSMTSLVQLTSAGNIFYLPYTAGDASTNSQAAWTKLSPSGLPAPSNTTSASSPSGSNANGSGTGTGSAPGSSKTGGAERFVQSLGLLGLCAAFGVMLL